MSTNTLDENTLISAEDLPLALSVCRGSYQRALVKGYQCLSGADLQGRARHWSTGYARSRQGLIARLWDVAGLSVREVRLKRHGRRVLVIGDVDLSPWADQIASESLLVGRP